MLEKKIVIEVELREVSLQFSYCVNQRNISRSGLDFASRIPIQQDGILK